jgi:hypothetical protein
MKIQIIVEMFEYNPDPNPNLNPNLNPNPNKLIMILYDLLYFYQVIKTSMNKN